jgi:anti-sigma factor RsiW
MTCQEAERELVAYHFGLVSEDARDALEAHLLGCSACLRAFLEVKRAVEIGEDSPPPSAASRAKLRGAIARAIGVTEMKRPWAWWERPLAFGLAASFVLASMVAVRAISMRAPTPPYAMSDHAGDVR